MLAITFEELLKLKYFNIKKEDLVDRFIPPLIIYDNEWKMYIDTENGLFPLRIVDIDDGFYISRNLVNENDIELNFFNFILKRNNFKENLEPLNHIYDDIYNLLASIEKIVFFSELYKNSKEHLKLCKYASVELESIFQNSRAIFENFQKIQNNLMKNTISANKDDFFSVDTICFNKNFTINNYIEKYKIPELLAKFYVDFQEFFFFILDMRNDISHSRKSFRLLLGEEGFSIPLNEYNLKELHFWNEKNTLKNDLGSLKSLVGYIILNTINALEEYSKTINLMIKLPDDILPSYNIYIRNDFNKILKILFTYSNENAWNKGK